MKYERLTERKEDGDWHLVDDTIWGVFNAVDCLAGLEDKIERGELISTVQAEQGEQEIAFFVAHNAEVRKQAVIEFAVKLKKKADTYNYDESYIDRSIMYTDVDDIVTEVCGK